MLGSSWCPCVWKPCGNPSSLSERSSVLKETHAARVWEFRGLGVKDGGVRVRGFGVLGV